MNPKFKKLTFRGFQAFPDIALHSPIAVLSTLILPARVPFTTPRFPRRAGCLFSQD